VKNLLPCFYNGAVARGAATGVYRYMYPQNQAKQISWSINDAKMFIELSYRQNQA